MFRGRLTFLLTLFLVLLAFHAPARADAGTVGQAISTCVLRDAPGFDAATLLRRPARFDCTTPQRDFGAGSFWVISDPLRIDTNRSANVRSTSVWQTKMTLYAAYADGHIAAIVTDGNGATRNLQLGAIIERKLPIRAEPLVRLLWHVENSSNLRGIVLAPTISSAAQSAESNMMLAAVYAGLAGICFALLLYNLGLARALPHAFLPFYCAMMMGMLLYGFSSSGALAWVFPEIENASRLKLNYLALAISGISATFFLRHFFEDGVIPRWLDRAVYIACLGVAVPTLTVLLFAPAGLRILDRAFALSFAVLISTAIPMIGYAWVKKSRYLGLFIVAWSAPIVLATLRTASGVSLIGYHFWLDNSTILSMAFEALLSSLAIAYRILLITRERDLARAQEITARMLADADPLTGLMNRRSFLREAIGRDEEQQLLLIDIDNFKRVNDTLGHDGGDEVLRLVARVLRSSALAESLVARIGGEEFAIVTPRSTGMVPEQLLATLRSARMPFDLTVTASIGMCHGRLARESDWKAMYLAADRALFDAKRAGRDRYRDAAQAA